MGACGASCGITRQRDRERAAARRIAQAAWPHGRSPGGGLGPDLGALQSDTRGALAAQIVEALPVRVIDVPEDGGQCAALYVIASVAAGSWVEHRLGRGERPEVSSEHGLRVCFSPVGPFATLQEVAVEASADPGGVWIVERRVAGIEDRRLQHMVRGVQGLLRKAKVVTLDAAFLAEPFADATLWSALFDHDPAVTSVGVYLAAEGS